MPFVYAGGRFLFFVHVPKTGGSSIEDYLMRRFGSVSMIDKNKCRGLTGTGLISPITHLAAHDLAEIIPLGADLVFALVRDPLNRILSEYYWQSGASWTSAMSFSTWLRVVITAARNEPRIYENHIRPQDDMVPVHAEIFRLEDGFDALVARLDEVTGSKSPDIRIGHLKRRKAREIQTRIFREDIELILEFFAVDYERFGYQRPNLDELVSDVTYFHKKIIAGLLAGPLVLRQKWGWVK